MALPSPLAGWLDPVVAVAATVWKRVQDRMLKTILLAGAAVALAAGWLLDLQPDEARLGLLLLNLFVALLLIFIGTTEIPRDRASRSVQFFLAKPLSRSQYVTGKFLGVLLIGELIFLPYALGFLIAVVARGLMRAPESALTLARLALHLTTLSALVVAVSVFLPEMGAVAFGFAFFFASFFVCVWPPLLKLTVPAILQPVGLLLYYPIPNAQHFLWSGGAVLTCHFVGLTALYTAAYCAATLAVAALWLRRRDLI